MAVKLIMVIPCYNEEPVLEETAKRLDAKYKSLIEKDYISKDSKIMFVDDGSKDKTWQIITELHNKNNVFSGLKLSRNRGHQNAVLAGLMTAKDEADVVISMDADLQDDINSIDGFLEEHAKGADVVYGVRASRETDTAFKRTTALMFYKLMNKLGVDSVYNHADYRLMSKRALNALAEYKEVNLFLRGMVPLIGYKSAKVTYDRSERFAGESKYPLKKMIAFALDGITSLSVKPIRLIFSAGLIIFVLSFFVLLYALIAHIAGKTVSGWTSTVASIWLIGGIQLLSIGVVGEYIGKIYNETKQRPRFIIEEYLKD
ncbi:MAG: glycosyltransferase family 2 protein [Christensenellaceae bacterium]|nr:glycosyltransferase family 2 protein [Christensenellaceae bacterium]